MSKLGKTLRAISRCSEKWVDQIFGIHVYTPGDELLQAYQNMSTCQQLWAMSKTNLDLDLAEILHII